MPLNLDSDLLRAQNDALDRHPNDHAVPHCCNDYCFLCGFEAAWNKQKERIQDAERKLEEERRRFVKAYYAQEARHRDDIELTAHLTVESVMSIAVEDEKKLFALVAELTTVLEETTHAASCLLDDCEECDRLGGAWIGAARNTAAKARAIGLFDPLV